MTLPAVSLKALHSARSRRDPYAFYAELHEQGTAAPLDSTVDG